MPYLRNMGENHVLSFARSLQYAVGVSEDGRSGFFIADSKTHTEKLREMLSYFCANTKLITSNADFRENVATCGEHAGWPVYTTEYTNKNKMPDCALEFFQQKCDIVEGYGSLIYFGAVLVALLVLLCHSKFKPSVDNPFPPLLADNTSDASSLGSDHEDPEKAPDAENPRTSNNQEWEVPDADIDTLCPSRRSSDSDYHSLAYS